MKKKIALAVAAAMTVSALALNVSAEEYTQVNLLVEGEAVETDQPAVIVDSRTMVPVRVIAETFGCEVDWDAETKTVTFTLGDIVATMVVGETTLNVTSDGVETTMEIDTPAVIINSRTMVPIRFLTELFGFNVEWDAETKTVNVTAGETAVSDETATEEETEEVEEEVVDEETDTDEESADEETAEDEETADEETEEDSEEETAEDEETSDEDTEEESDEETTDEESDTETTDSEDELLDEF